MGERDSVKQIMHMSSASCLSLAVLSQPWRQGRQGDSPLMPPQVWPQGRTRGQLLAWGGGRQVRQGAKLFFSFGEPKWTKLARSSLDE